MPHPRVIKRSQKWTTGPLAEGPDIIEMCERVTFFKNPEAHSIN